MGNGGYGEEKSERRGKEKRKDAQSLLDRLRIHIALDECLVGVLPLAHLEQLLRMLQPAMDLRESEKRSEY